MERRITRHAFAREEWPEKENLYTKQNICEIQKDLKRKRKRVNDLGGGEREYHGIKRMGKNVEPRMWINTKKTRRGKAIPCLEETTALMTALKKHNFDASKCLRETELLDKCTSMHAKAPKVKNTINYHLQRLARLARVAR